MSKPKTVIPVEGDYHLFCQRVVTVEHAEDVLSLIAVLTGSCTEIEAQRDIRVRNGTASEGWLHSSASALKYYGMKIKAAREHYTRLVEGQAPQEVVPSEAWLVTICNNSSSGDICTRLSHVHPAEYFLDMLERSSPEDRDGLTLFNSVKIPPPLVERARRLLNNLQ